MLEKRFHFLVTLLTLISVVAVCPSLSARAPVPGLTDSVLKMRETRSKMSDKVGIERSYEFGTEISFALRMGEIARLVPGENPFGLTEIFLGPMDGNFHVYHFGKRGHITSGYAPMKLNSAYSASGSGWTSIASWEMKHDQFLVKYRAEKKEKKAKEPAIERPPTSTILTESERIFGLVTVYRMAKQHFAYFDQVSNLDWDQAFMDFLPQVEAEKDLYEYYRILQRFAALLQDGHTQVYLPPSIRKNLDRLPLSLDFIENQWVVIMRHPTQEILEKDIPPGSILESIEGLPPGEYFEKSFFPYISAGNLERKHTVLNWEANFPKDTKIQMKFRYPDGSRHSRMLPANRKTIEWTQDLREKFIEPIHRAPYFSFKRLPGDILYVRYGRCDSSSPWAFAELIVDSRSQWPRALILDLRGNGGGNTPTEVAQCLISKPIKNFQFRSRWSISYIDAQMRRASQSAQLSEKLFAERKSWYGLDEKYTSAWFSPGFANREIQPEGIHYDGPLVILVDGYTGSAAEDLVVLLRGNDRGTVIGEKTSGSTGQPLFFDLPGGGSCRICTVNVRFPDGREFVGPGIQPDIPVERTIKGIAAGKDEILDAALKFLQRDVGRKKSAEKTKK